MRFSIKKQLRFMFILQSIFPKPPFHWTELLHIQTKGTVSSGVTIPMSSCFRINHKTRMNGATSAASVTNDPKRLA